ncbi:hypothetical protein CYMTET_9601 [Cymbomonas tetramitiformis]|uniref:Uncharacterized protein n=1 Tax=Cymbomonas tetramitiformis TaxID=36881 RepID=A0AAE0GQN9_9CHLO|nr:hypothetical protein CYMTET_9601 [Cymbomonas tetramitiformis]
MLRPRFFTLCSESFNRTDLRATLIRFVSGSRSTTSRVTSSLPSDHSGEEKTVSHVQLPGGLLGEIRKTYANPTPLGAQHSLGCKDLGGIVRVITSPTDLRPEASASTRPHRHLPVSERRTAIWESIEEGASNAANIGWLLRGFFRDHVRLMNNGELDQFEQILAYDSEDIVFFLSAKFPVPRRLAQNAVFSQLVQYHRYWEVSNQNEYR